MLYSLMRTFGLAVLLGALTACFPVRVDSEGSVQDPARPNTRDVAAAATPRAPQDQAFLETIQGLSQRTLSPGACGLFLWARVPERQLVFFANLEDDGGVMNLGGQERKLVRTAARGERIMGLFPYQKLQAPGLEAVVNVIAEPREGLTAGALVPKGTLRLASDAGWEVILPVAGLVGCQDQAEN